MYIRALSKLSSMFKRKLFIIKSENITLCIVCDCFTVSNMYDTIVIILKFPHTNFVKIIFGEKY